MRGASTGVTYMSDLFDEVLMRASLACEGPLGGSRPFFCGRAELDQAAAVTSSAMSLGGMTVAAYRRDRPNLGLTIANVPSAAFAATVYLRELPPMNRWCDGAFQPEPTRHIGELRCLDMRHAYVADVIHPFHTLNIYVPQGAFDTLAKEMGVQTIDGLVPTGAEASLDVLMYDLARAIVPLLDQPKQLERMLAEHVLSAMRLHLAVCYGGLTLPTQRQTASLAGWQMHKVKELMLDDLSADVGIEELAQACGLSAGHFIRAFRGTVGVSPHRWRTYQRIEKSKTLLTGTDTPISAIAMYCGFSGQSHFTRVFSAVTSFSPGAYRRIRRCR